MANPNWIKNGPSPNPAGNTRYRDRFKQVQKGNSGFEKKVGIYLTKQFGRFVGDIDKLNERDRVRAYLELLAYSMPKKSAVSADNLSAEEVEMLYNKITTLVGAKQN